MRIPAILASLGATLVLGACTYVERPAPTPAVVQAAPGQVVTVPPGVTVRPAY